LLALRQRVQSISGASEIGGNRLTFIGKCSPEVGRLRRIRRLSQLAPSRLNRHRRNITVPLDGCHPSNRIHSRRDGSPTMCGGREQWAGGAPRSGGPIVAAPRDLWDSRALCRIGVIDAAAGRAVPAIRSYESVRKDYPVETALPAVE